MRIGPEPSRAPRSREGIKHALAVRSEERDRIAGDLLDLEAHTAFQLLKSTELRGETKHRWDRASAAMEALWSLFDAYGSTLDRADALLARRPKPNAPEWAELTALLSGRSVQLKPEPKPVEQRTLLAPADRSLTLDDAVSRMDAAFRGTAQVIRDVDAIWNRLFERLREAEGTLLAIRELHDKLGDTDPDGKGAGVTPDADLTRLVEELARFHETVLRDPFGADSAQARFDRICTDLTVLHRDLEQAHAVRATYGQRRTLILERVKSLRAAEEEVRGLRARVAAKIATPLPPTLDSTADTLVDQLTMLDSPGVRWRERARRLELLDQAAGEATDRARTAATALLGLLGRRDELIGRLDAYRAKAVRLGRAEDPPAARCYQRAHDALRASPCELREADAAVTAYRRAIRGGDR